MESILKPYLFYWMVDAQQGEERGGGRFMYYNVIYDVDMDSAFKKYEEWYKLTFGHKFNPVKLTERNNVWKDYFLIIGTELPYDVYKWREFNELMISSRGQTLI